MKKGTKISERLLSERMMRQPKMDIDCATVLSTTMRDATHHDLFHGRYIKALQNCLKGL
jgi:hypothetical protein